MVIITFIISIVSLVIAIIALLGVSIAINGLISNKVISDLQKQQKKDNIRETDEYIQGANEGRDLVWLTIQLALFQMFKDAEIFDYEGSVENLSSKMTALIDDNKYCLDLHKELISYLKEQDHDSNNSNDY